MGNMIFDFNSILDLFPLSRLAPSQQPIFQEVFDEIDQCVKISKRDFMIEHILLGYLRYIEKLPEARKKKLSILPWYTDSLQYIRESALIYSTPISNRNLQVEADVFAFANSFRKYAYKLDLEKFIYLLIFVNIHKLQNRHVIPYGQRLARGEMLQHSVLSRMTTIYPLLKRFSSFDDFLATPYASTYSNIIKS